MITLKIRAIFIFAFSTTMLISSCTQDEGIGGNSHITGVLIEQYYNEDFSILQYETPAKDEDIFILFGDDINVGENTSTSYSGTFEFNYLWPGNYNVYYYSDDSTSTQNEDIALMNEFILSKGETKDLGTMYLLKTLDWDEGNASIKGRVKIINYNNATKYPNLEVKDVSFAQEYDVYINYNNSEFYTDRIKTDDKGYFVFENLIKGQYKVFLYSENIEGNTENEVITFYFEITDLDQQIVIEDNIVVNQL